ncbi:hypothetical protein [Limnoglobus roseus]|uniref:Tetratricopeptide repeat protein n=1 Tax=Limnoglobus roseus TaxID=2598579 RepID=A0A5C1AAC9_9BACT|nr:hypothetical protein [Limnoglobus roseus]QEL15177.1 hypothetical protein PX52LOC_02092 [Limnoglobus roseus]
MIRWIVWIVLSCILCGSTVVIIAAVSVIVKKPSLLPAADSPPPALENVGPPVDEQEAMQFGLQLEAAAAGRDKAALDRLAPMEALYNRAVSDMDTSRLSPDLRTAFVRRFTNEIGGLIAGDGSYKLVRVHTVDGRPRVFFRILNGKGGLNYHDILLARTATGQVVLEDVGVMTMGETLGKTMRRLTIDSLTAGQRGTRSERIQLMEKHAKELVDFHAKVREGKAGEAMVVYRRLPDVLRKDKDTQLIALGAALAISDEAHVREIEAYQQAHPDDPNLDLISLDLYLLTRQHKQSLKALAAIEKTVGGDPCVDAIRATVLAETGRFAEARTAAERAIREEPTLTEAYWARIAVAIGERDHPAALKWFKAIAEKRQVTLNFPAIVQSPESKPFARSPEFQELKAWYANRGR